MAAASADLEEASGFGAGKETAHVRTQHVGPAEMPRFCTAKSLADTASGQEPLTRCRDWPAKPVKFTGYWILAQEALWLALRHIKPLWSQRWGLREFWRLETSAFCTGGK